MILVTLLFFSMLAEGLEADNSFTLDTDISMQAIPLDSAAFFEVALVNTGDTRDDYQVLLIDNVPDNWMTVLCIDSLCLPGDSGQVMLNPGDTSFVKPDMHPQMNPGDGEFTVVVQSQNDPGNIQQVPLRAVSGYSVLLVNNSSAENQYKSYYENALISGGVNFNYWDRCFSPFRGSDLIYYDYLVIYSGDRLTDLFSNDEISALSGYLDSGGDLLISGQGLASALQGTAFLENYLGVSYINTHFGSMMVDGVGGDPIGDGLHFSITGGDGADNQTEPDQISLTAGSVTVFTYGSGELSGSRLDNNDSKTVFLAYGIEAVDNAADRDAIISRSFDWFGYTTSVYNEIFNTPRIVELSGNYPNPFNGFTTIRYALNQSSEVKIEIYDLLGRNIETLLDSEQQAGIHQVTWNARNISSGVYFYSIQAGGNFLTDKMILLR
jgi:hypothetical protein